MTQSWQELHSNLLNSLLQGFHTHTSMAGITLSTERYLLEEICDYIRRPLARAAPQECGFGLYTSMHNVMYRLLTLALVVTRSICCCPHGHGIVQDERVGTSCEVTMLGPSQGKTVQEYLDDFSAPLASNCKMCETPLFRRFSFTFCPPLLAVELTPNLPSFDSVLSLRVDDRYCRYSLCGVIYHAGDHFTACVVTKSGIVWFHDRITTFQRECGSGHPCENSDMPHIVMAH